MFIATSLVLTFKLTPYINEDATLIIPAAVRLTYGPFYRIAWALVVCWVIYAYVCGHGGYYFSQLFKISYTYIFIYLKFIVKYYYFNEMCFHNS